MTLYLQVSGGEDTDKLQDLLGDYKKMSPFIMRGTSSLGVERQPATPLPGGKYNNRENNLDRSRDPSRQSHSAVKLENRIKSVPGQQGQNTKVKNAVNNYSGASSNRSFSDDKSSLVNSAKMNHTDHQRPSAQSSASSQKSSSLVNSQKLPKPEPPNQSTKKEPTLSTKQHPPVSNREPVLQSLNQELIGQSRTDAAKSNSKPVLNSENKVTESAGKFDSVLKEKEVENRNTNSCKNKNRPRVFIPEVRNMLSEILRSTL